MYALMHLSSVFPSRKNVSSFDFQTEQCDVWAHAAIAVPLRVYPAIGRMVSLGSRVGSPFSVLYVALCL
jgi:hypothetical protein